MLRPIAADQDFSGPCRRGFMHTALLHLLLWLLLCAHQAHGYLGTAGETTALLNAVSAGTALAPTQDDGYPGASSPQYLAMCVIVRDQKDDMLEWIEHYLNLGAGKVYVFDHASEPPIVPAFAPLVQAGLVEYQWTTTSMMYPVWNETKRRDGRVSPQVWVYYECLRRYGRRHHWIGFFDSDEFLLLKDRAVKNLPTFLKDYEQYGGLAVNWMMFGSSGHMTRPNMSTLAAYGKCFRLRFMKTIANTRYAWAPANDPHTFRYRDRKFAVNERFERQNISQTPVWAGDKVVLNHYVSKSYAQSLAKHQRGDGNGGGKPMTFFKHMDRLSTNHCIDAMELMLGRSYLRDRGLNIPGLIPPEQRAVPWEGVVRDKKFWNASKAGR